MCGTPIFQTAALVWFVAKKSNSHNLNFLTTYFNCVNNKCNKLLWLSLAQLAHPRVLIESQFTDF